MGIPTKVIKDILIHKGVYSLYHANTVATTIIFLKEGGLLSRGAVEEKGLVQTPQYTDERDKQLGVYDDIFFDSCDIEERGHKINQYGPVLFQYNVGVLDSIGTNCVKITKSNPCYWSETEDETDHYFMTAEELKCEYNYGSFCQHLTICDRHIPLPFVPHLQKVQIDDPELEDVDIDHICQTLSELLQTSCPTISVEKRKCSSKCLKKYQRVSEEDINRYFKY